MLECECGGDYGYDTVAGEKNQIVAAGIERAIH